MTSRPSFLGFVLVVVVVVCVFFFFLFFWGLVGTYFVFDILTSAASPFRTHPNVACVCVCARARAPARVCMILLRSAVFFLGTPGSNQCPGFMGEDPLYPVTKAQCSDAGKAAAALQGQVAARPMYPGSWAHVPPGCSVLSGGDWTAHYNSGRDSYKDS